MGSEKSLSSCCEAIRLADKLGSAFFQRSWVAVESRLTATVKENEPCKYAQKFGALASGRHCLGGRSFTAFHPGAGVPLVHVKIMSSIATSLKRVSASSAKTIKNASKPANLAPSVLLKLKTSKCPITIELTGEQYRRLTTAAFIYGATIQDILLAGGLSFCDCADSNLWDARETGRDLIGVYAKKRRAYADPKAGTGTKYGVQVSRSTMKLSNGRTRKAMLAILDQMPVTVDASLS